ncbi:MAG: hypothetical protein ACI3Y4_06265 [Candidatus Cryptobacteroides sp.]
MKKFIMKSILALAAVFTVAGCVLEQYETDQFSGVPSLTAFAPNPIYRGGELTLIGSYLEQVAEVQIPGVEPITEITVETSGEKSRIKVTLPNTTEEVGVITLVTKSGTVLTSKTELTYTEPVVFGDFSPKTAMPGDVITVTGDYMNLIREVIFEGAAYATGEALSEQTRWEMNVVVPDNAITGRFILGDADEVAEPDNVANKVYSSEELVIGDPTVNSLGNITPKAGDKVIVTGKYLAMIASASVTDVPVEFEVEAGDVHGKSLTFIVPETAGEGDIILKSFAGKEFVAGSIAPVVPTELSIAATERYKAGLTAVISGKNLDLVTGVKLGGASCDYTYDEQAKTITLTISEKSVDGGVELSMANGTVVALEQTIELVKPVITSVAPLELYAGDENVVVDGTDLDLVTGVAIGAKAEEFILENGVISISTTVSSVSGKIILTLANGVKVESDDEVKMNYHAFVVVTERPDAQHIGEEVVLKGSNFDLVENIFIGDAKVTKYLARTAEEVRFLMPYNKVGSYTMSFHLFSGDIENQPAPIEVLLEREFITAWEGSLQIGWGEGGRVAVPVTAFEGVNAGAKLRLHYTQVDGQWDQAQLNNGAWTTISFPEVPSGTLVPTDLYGWFEDGILDRITELTLTKEILDNILSNAGDYEGVLCGMIIQGSGLTFTKVDIVGEIAQEITLWEGEAIVDDWGNQPYLLSDAGVELAAANAQAGQTVYFYIEPLEAAWQVKIQEGHWGPEYAAICSAGNTNEGEFNEYDLEANGGKYGLVLTEDILAAAYTQQWWGGTFLANGDNLKITKITLL